MSQEEQRLATREESELSRLPVYEDPGVVLARTEKWAEALMRVVEKQHMYVGIPNKQTGEIKKYLEVEAWQLVGSFAQARAIPGTPYPLYEDDVVVGYETLTEVFVAGEKVGQGTSSCGLDAFPTQGKEGSEKIKACKSASQTWSVSKAMRNTYGFVAKMAGFEATTAEEMDGSSGPSQLDTDPEMFCPLHQKEWFKSKNMRNFSHPVEGEKGPKGGQVWCPQEEFLNDLNQRMRAVVRGLDLEDEERAARNKLWQDSNPDEKYRTLLAYENPANGDTPESSQEPVCGLCQESMGDEDAEVHKACADAADVAQMDRERDEEADRLAGSE